MRKKYEISKGNAAEIKEYRQKVKDKYVDRRLYALQLLGEGEKTKESRKIEENQGETKKSKAQEDVKGDDCLYDKSIT